MLNCTDLACILHHHHYYAQLHHLKHGTHHVEDGDAMSTETDDVNNDPLLLNETESELTGLSHLDGPNESVYMICGVLIAMILVGIIIVLLATIISKLRKREEHSNSVHPAEVVLQTAGTPTAPAPVATQQTPMQQPQPLPPDPIAYSGQFFWQYPPPPPQLHTLYSNDQETLVQNLPAERPGFCRGFRKNLGGRWRRLVKRKPTTEVYTIPAELKPQLKEIYVY